MTVSTLIPAPAIANVVMMAGRTTGGTGIAAAGSFAVIVTKAIVRIVIEGIHIDELHTLFVSPGWYRALHNKWR
jgi:chromate transport protein ChrA